MQPRIVTADWSISWGCTELHTHFGKPKAVSHNYKSNKQTQNRTSMLHTGGAKFKTYLIFPGTTTTLASVIGYPELDSGAAATQLHLVLTTDRAIKAWQIDEWYIRELHKVQLRTDINTAAFKEQPEFPTIPTLDQQTRRQKWKQTPFYTTR